MKDRNRRQVAPRFHINSFKQKKQNTRIWGKKDDCQSILERLHPQRFGFAFIILDDERAVMVIGLFRNERKNNPLKNFKIYNKNMLMH